MPDALQQALEEARAEMRQVQACLLKPSAETLDQCRPQLERARGALGHLRQALDAGTRQPTPALVDGLRSLLEEIHRAEILLRAAGDLYLGSLESLIASSGLYNEAGSPTLPPPPRSVSILG